VTPKRRNFTTADKLEMKRRATDAKGRIRCEECGCVCVAKEGLGYEFDHTIAEALILDKSRKLTAADGKLLCCGRPDSCHDRKTAKGDVPAIAKAKRREAKAAGVRPSTPVKPIESAPMPISERTAAVEKRGPRQALPPRPLFVDR
jgi:hypothetical protein